MSMHSPLVMVLMCVAYIALAHIGTAVAMGHLAKRKSRQGHLYKKFRNATDARQRKTLTSKHMRATALPEAPRLHL